MKRVFGAVLGMVLIGPIAPADAGCSLFSGTADAVAKPEAVARAQDAVKEAVGQWKASKNVRNASMSPARAKPQPYWRDSVSADLYVKPDVVTGSTYTICWRGVVSPFVCTSGSRVCY